MGSETYFELTKRAVPIIKNETAHLSWRNSVITVRTTKRVNFLEYSYNLDCLERELDFVESSILCPKNSPAEHVCKSDFWSKSEMRNLDYTEMIVNPSYWPHNQGLTQEMTSVVMCKWSPLHFSKSDCVLAVLNNIGGVEFFGRKLLEWKSILNLSPYISKILQYNKTPLFFEDLKDSVNVVETSAICWAIELNSDDSCFFVTAQRDGAVLVWQIFSDMEVKIRGRIPTDMTEITAMKWIPKSGNNFYLICTNVLGLIHILHMEVGHEVVNLLHFHALWPHEDRMMTVSLKYKVIDNHIVFVCSKHRHLLIQVIDDNGKVLSQYLNNVNDHRITDIAYTKDSFYLSTVNVKIYKINIGLQNGSLNVNLEQLNLKDSYPTYELHSLRFSSNNLVCALAMMNRRVLCRKEAYKMEVVFVSTDSKLESIVSTIMLNPTKKLTYYWDCVELLRFQITKMKVIPKLDYDELYASKDAYILKVYLIIMTYLTNLRKVLRVCGVTLPETSREVVKEKILYFHAESLLNSLCETCQKEGQLSDLDMEILYGCKIYLEYYSRKYKTSITFDENVLNALESQCEYVCQCCDDKIEGFTCKKGHLNMFCMESFTPIVTDDYLVCRCCGSTARTDLELGNPQCIFCDLNLVKPD